MDELKATVVEKWLDKNPKFLKEYLFKLNNFEFFKNVESDVHDAQNKLLKTTVERRVTTASCRSYSFRKPGGGYSNYKKPVAFSEEIAFDHGMRVSKSPFIGNFLLETPIAVNKSPIFDDLMKTSEIDENNLLFELVKDIANELNLTTLCHKILQNVLLLIKGDRSSIFLVQENHSGYVENTEQTHVPHKYLVAKVFDVDKSRSHETNDNLMTNQLRITWGHGIIGHVAATGCMLNIKDAYKDSRFSSEMDKKTGYKTKNVLCLPIISNEGKVIGVAQIINKIVNDVIVDEGFSSEDVQIFQKYLTFCAIGINNAQLIDKCYTEIKHNELLLSLAHTLFEIQSDFPKMVKQIMFNTQSIIPCERCSVLLVDPDSKGVFTQVYDMELKNDENCDGKKNVNVPINIGITGYVAATGNYLNINDAYADARFDSSVDEASNFVTKNILCMPIKNAIDKVVGVVQLLNKLDGSFNKNDIKLFEAFSIFCGLAIHNSSMYEKCNHAIAKQKIALEVLSYHASAHNDEVIKLMSHPLPSTLQLGLAEFNFDDQNLSETETCLAVVRMFTDLDLINKFRIDQQVLYRFVLTVKKNYRTVTYHNWRHAFNVAQFMFSLLQIDVIGKFFNPLEKMALIVSCLCHDLDHRGVNNNYMTKISSPMVQLYGSSVLEHHHYDHCIMILNSSGNDIFANVPQEDYCELMKIVQSTIIATDLAVHMKNRDKMFEEISKYPDLDSWKHNHTRVAYLRSLLMTVCDLSATMKPWKIQHRISHLLSEEFFQQGDIEKNQLNETPIDMMDRKKQDLMPKMQVSFMDFICVPLYSSITKLIPQLKALEDGLISNKNMWSTLSVNLSQQN